MSNEHGNFYCLNCFHFFGTKKQTWITLESPKKYLEANFFVIVWWFLKTLRYLEITRFVSHADFESLIENI